MCLAKRRVCKNACLWDVDGCQPHESRQAPCIPDLFMTTETVFRLGFSPQPDDDPNET